MQNQPKGAGSDACNSTVAQDRADQSVVLSHVLALHPIHLTIPDLVRELADGFAGSDAVERAVRDLTSVGLLDCPGGIVKPSRAALHFDALPRA